MIQLTVVVVYATYEYHFYLKLAFLNFGLRLKGLIDNTQA